MTKNSEIRNYGKVSTIETKYKMSLNQRDNLVKLENGQTENTKQTS